MSANLRLFLGPMTQRLPKGTDPVKSAIVSKNILLTSRREHWGTPFREPPRVRQRCLKRGTRKGERLKRTTTKGHYLTSTLMLTHGSGLSDGSSIDFDFHQNPRRTTSVDTYITMESIVFLAFSPSSKPSPSSLRKTTFKRFHQWI